MGLLLEQVDEGSWVYDNLQGRAYVLGFSGIDVIRVSTLRVIVPRVEYVDEATTKKRVEVAIWASVHDVGVRSASVDLVLEDLRNQVRLPPPISPMDLSLSRLYYTGHGIAEAFARTTGLPCYESDCEGQPDDILIGLPREEYLGFHLRDTSSKTEGIVVFPGSIAAIRILS